MVNMNEYIERETAIESIMSEPQDAHYPHWYAVKIKSIQAADVAPMRHGRWEEADWVEPDCHGFGTIRTPKAALRCSNCKNCFKKELLWKDNYCPNCGSKMDLEG